MADFCLKMQKYTRKRTPIAEIYPSYGKSGSLNPMASLEFSNGVIGILARNSEVTDFAHAQ